MDPKDLLNLLDLGGSSAEATPSAPALTPAGGTTPPAAGPTALELDAWGLRRGRELHAEANLARWKLDASAAADFFAAAFDPDPRLVPACVDPARHQFLAALLVATQLRQPDRRRELEKVICRLVAARIALGIRHRSIAGRIHRRMGESAQRGIGHLVVLGAMINVTLGLLNLLPIPVLDGGWLLFLLLEALRGKPLNPEHQGIAQFIGLALILLLMLFATYSDIHRLLSPGGS